MKNNAVKVVMALCCSSLLSCVSFGMNKPYSKEELEKKLNKIKKNYLSKKKTLFEFTKKTDYWALMRMQDEKLKRVTVIKPSHVNYLCSTYPFKDMGKNQKATTKLLLEGLSPIVLRKCKKKLIDRNKNNMLVFTIITKDKKLFEKILQCSGPHGKYECNQKAMCDDCEKGRRWAIMHKNKSGKSFMDYFYQISEKEQAPFIRILKEYGLTKDKIKKNNGQYLQKKYFSPHKNEVKILNIKKYRKVQVSYPDSSCMIL